MYRLLPFLLLLSSCTATQMMVNYPLKTVPMYTIEPAPQKIIVLNTYDVRVQKYRDNKEALFVEMIDSVMGQAAQTIRTSAGIPVTVLRGYTSPSASFTTKVQELMKEEQATHAIVVTSFDVEFVQTDVDVTKNKDGSKSREAFYDIRSSVGYSFYKGDGLMRNDNVVRQKFHSSRSVASGLLAAGPNVVVQQKDAYELIVENLYDYLNRYFPGQRLQYRSIFTGKEFEPTGAAIKRGDYEAALIESMKLTRSADPKIAAKANYNCAVFFERKNQPEEARKYLEASLQLERLPQASQMVLDY